MENHNGLSIGDLASTDLALVSASYEYRARNSQEHCMEEE